MEVKMKLERSLRMSKKKGVGLPNLLCKLY